ncbi:AP2/ERF family transcription factor [Serratia sp. IR-2025]|uniref:AP2/ERF family transcription factor n=1 Tax=Serratia nevei TaxID=2703794 RepID=UPI0027D2F6C3|nr:AP2/ERF family transcription factor [Serratia nevei]WMC77411.1 HNH endonuclease [Serratia nevei]WMC78687.1 HNH endonuclease [Serratia nevei]
MRNSISLIELKRLLHYDHDTGVFTRKISWKNTHPVGSIVGVVDRDGYLKAVVKGKTYLLHRLAWFYVHGSWPVGTIDHIDLDKQNNKIANLRDISFSCNLRNRKKRKNNKSGYKGVCWSNKGAGWRASICVNKKITYLGTFANKEDAALAYDRAAILLHGEYARLNFAGERGHENA